MFGGVLFVSFGFLFVWGGFAILREMLRNKYGWIWLKIIQKRALRLGLVLPLTGKASHIKSSILGQVHSCVCDLMFLTSKPKAILKGILGISGEIRGEFSWVLLHSLKSLEFGGWAVFTQTIRRGIQSSSTKPFCNSSNHWSLSIIIIRAEISQDLHNFCGIKRPLINPTAPLVSTAPHTCETHMGNRQFFSWVSWRFCIQACRVLWKDVYPLVPFCLWLLFQRQEPKNQTW